MADKPSMGFIDQAAVLERFRRDGRNSSHFVWFLAGLRFYECANHWIFAYQRVGEVTLIALEPLIPGAPTEYTAEHERQLADAWREFRARAVEPGIAMFVSIYEPLAKLLRANGFQTLKVGEEPWVNLPDCIPKGNAAKGVRSARNQAIKSGLRVEEWTATDVVEQPAKREQLDEVIKEWKGGRLVNLSGYLNTTEPFAYAKDRRYFVLRSSDRIEAFLVATPIPGIRSYFLEDMALRPGAARGAGELLTLEAMVALRDSGSARASLGAVSVAPIDDEGGRELSPVVRFFLTTAPRYLQKLYHFGGLEVYRKRFKPQAWDSIYLAVQDLRYDRTAGRPAESTAWFKALFALLRALKPRLQLSPRWIFGQVARPFRRYPLTVAFAVVSYAAFAHINGFGDLPARALAQFGFSGSAPWTEWLRRSLVSDLLYFDREHFWVWGNGFLLVVAWAERTQRRGFLVLFLLGTSAFDDFNNYALLIKPLNYFQPQVFSRLVSTKDVGSSLCLATLFGLQICQFRRVREPLFVLTALTLVLGLAFQSAQLSSLILNLNHFLFLGLGYLAGKLRFEQERERSRQAAKGKPPEAKCVARPSEKRAA